LETIPFWSFSYQEAQNQLKDDSQQAQLLEQLVTGLSRDRRRRKEAKILRIQ
jgi:hypothetical protein